MCARLRVQQTLNSERKRARGDRYAPVCSRWLTKRLVKRLLTAAVTAAAGVGGRRPPIGGRSRPTVVDLRPPARKRTHTRAPAYSITGLSLPATVSAPTTGQNDHTALGQDRVHRLLFGFNNVLSAAPSPPHRGGSFLYVFTEFVHTVFFSLSNGRPRRSLRKYLEKKKEVYYTIYHRPIEWRERRARRLRIYYSREIVFLFRS